MRVKEIFQNLLGNAIKYTESGTITLSLGGEREENRYKIRAFRSGYRSRDG